MVVEGTSHQFLYILSRNSGTVRKHHQDTRSLRSSSLNRAYGQSKPRKKPRLAKLDYSLKEAKETIRYSKSELQTKSSQLPYLDSIYLSDYALSDEPSKAYISPVSVQEKLAGYKSKYPRLCKDVDFGSVTEFHPRSEIWVLQFIERCYDSMSSALSKHGFLHPPSSSHRSVLASVDPFPVVVSQYISQLYSVSHMRNELLANILFTLENIIDKSYSIPIENTKSVEFPAFSTDRVFLFVQFLAENFDNYAISMFLHTRLCIQDSLKIRFHDILALQRKLKASEVLPSSNHWVCVKDLSLPQCPVVCLAFPHFKAIVNNIFAEASQTPRDYFIDRVLDKLYQRYQSSCNLRSIIVSSERSDFLGLPVSKSEYVPCSIILSVVCEVWCSLPQETRARLTKREAHSTSLRQLSQIYDNNGQSMEELEDSVTRSEQSLALLESEIAAVEARIGRLDRLLSEGREEDSCLSELRAARLKLTQLTASRLALRSELLARKMTCEHMRESVDALWMQVMGTAGPLTSATSPANINRWRLEAADLLISAISQSPSLRMHDDADVAYESLESESLVLDEEIAKGSYSENRKSRERTSAEYVSYDVLARIRKLEEEAAELSAIGSDVSSISHQDLDLERFEWKPGARLLIRKDSERSRRNRVFDVAAKFSIECIATAYSSVVDRLSARRRAADEFKANADAVLMMVAETIIDDHAFDIISEALRVVTETAKEESLVENCLFIAVENTLDWIVDGSLASERILSFTERTSVQYSLLRRYFSVLRINRRATSQNMEIATLKAAESHNLKRKLALSFDLWRRVVRDYRRAAAIRLRVRAGVLRRCFNSWTSAARRMLEESKASSIKREEEAMSATIIQRMMRGFRCRRSISRMKAAAAVTTRLFRKWRGRSYMRNKRLSVRLLEEKSVYIQSASIYRDLQYCFRSWRRIRARGVAAHRLALVIQKYSLHAALQWWKYDTISKQNECAVLAEAAIAIQTRFRVFYTKKNVLDYYTWAAQFRKLQHMIREWILHRRFNRYILYNRCAVTLQRHIRGHLLRNRMRDDRIADIHSAAIANSFQKLNYYLSRYPQLAFSTDREGNSLLHAAAMGASKRAVKMMLKLGLDPNALNQQGYTPLHLVIQSSSAGRDECFDYMVERGCDDRIKAPGGVSSLMLAAMHGRAQIVQQLLDYGAEVNEPDDEGNSILQVACSGGHIGVVRRLLEHGVDPNTPAASGYPPIYFAIDAPEGAAVCQVLIDYDASVNVYHEETLQTPLMVAAMRGAVDVVGLFLAYSSGVLAVDANGWSVCHYAAARVPGSPDIYSALVTADADFECKDHEGLAPIHISAMYGNAIFLKCLLKGGSDPNTRNLRGNNVLAKHRVFIILRRSR